MGRQNRANEDGGIPAVTKQSGKEQTSNERKDSRQSPKSQAACSRLVELFHVNLKTDKEHEQQFANFGKKLNGW